MSARFTDYGIIPPPQRGAVKLLHVGDTHAVADEWRRDRLHPCVAGAPVARTHCGFAAAIAATDATTPSEAA